MNNWRDQLKNETALIAYLDFANMIHWQRRLGWRFRVEDLIYEIKSLGNIPEVRIYFGVDTKKHIQSESFHRRLRKAGAIVIAKPVKYIKKTVSDALLFKQTTLTLFNGDITKNIQAIVEQIRDLGITIEEQKCNFDVEMALDMLDATDRISGIILFSGDSDLRAPLERLKLRGKRIYVVGVRGMTSKELHEVKDLYIDFGKLYRGKRTYISENPANGGTA